MKKMILILAFVFSATINTQATTSSFDSEIVTDCMRESMRRADIDLANGSITSSQYFGRVQYYRSQCAFSN